MHRSIASFVVLLSSTASFASATSSAMADLGVQMLEVPVVRVIASSPHYTNLLRCSWMMFAEISRVVPYRPNIH